MASLTGEQAVGEALGEDLGSFHGCSRSGVGILQAPWAASLSRCVVQRK